MKNYTDITFILDKSGSMASVATDTIGGFNQFLRDQAKEPGEALSTLVMFNDSYHVHHEATPLNSCPLLTPENYVPEGNTALLDCLGHMITRTGKRFEAMPESDRPEKVLMVIITDGHENASREYTHTIVVNMITHQQEKYKWHFVYLGANQDAIKVGQSYGFHVDNTANYVGGATEMAFSSVSCNTKTLRGGAGSGQMPAFSKEQRAKLVVDKNIN